MFKKDKLFDIIINGEVMESIIIEGVKYNLNIEYRKIKKIYIRYNESTLYIKVPLKTKDSDLIKIINDNKESILKIVKKVDKKVRFSYENGSEIPFYGKNYHIIYSDDTFIRNDFIYLNRENPIEAYNKLARTYGKIFYKERIEYFINKYNLPYKVNSIVIREMKTRYGVCNIKDKKISFQLHLAIYPLECIDYVIIHELTHFKVQNHSKEFYYEVSKILPDYKIRIKKLKEIY